MMNVLPGEHAPGNDDLALPGLLREAAYLMQVIRIGGKQLSMAVKIISSLAPIPAVIAPPPFIPSSRQRN